MTFALRQTSSAPRIGWWSAAILIVTLGLFSSQWCVSSVPLHSQMRACMNKELCAALYNSEDSEVTFQDGERAQPLRTTRTKRRRKDREKSWSQYGGSPVTLGLCDFLRLCTRTGVRLCRGAVRAYKRSAERVGFYRRKRTAKSPIFLKYLRVFFFLFFFFRPRTNPTLPPCPPPAKLTCFWLTSLHHLQVSPLLSRCFGVREAFDYRAVGTWRGNFVAWARAGPVPTGCSSPLLVEPCS